jgi:hypothetical protein
VIIKFQRLKGKFYRSIARPTILYGLEYWVVDRKIEKSMSVAEIRMLGSVVPNLFKTITHKPGKILVNNPPHQKDACARPNV